jgi:hypothetical protein
MTRFGQWWLRNVRAGYAYAEGFHRYGAAPERYCARELKSNLAWGLGLPAFSFGLALPTLGGSLGLLGLYGVLYRRVREQRVARGDTPEAAALYAKHTVMGKLAQAQGALQFHSRRLRGKKATLIEYK